MTPPAPSTAVLLVAHGSRRAEANADLARLAESLRTRRDSSAIPFDHVEIAYLELATPTIPEAAAACVAHGATRVLLLPWFLSAGTHVSDDLERYRAEFAAAHPQTEFRLCPPLGLHPLMVDALLDRLAEGSLARLGEPSEQRP